MNTLCFYSVSGLLFDAEVKFCVEGMLQSDMMSEAGIVEVLLLPKRQVRKGLLKLALAMQRWRDIAVPSGPARESDRNVTGRGTQASVSHRYGTAMTCHHFSIRSPGLWSSILARKEGKTCKLTAIAR